eukprot:TRINITY_DN10520_c0_g1_i1.p1 TRINITY_DN10520_c0_g1~~TRINITY_DN10520_c0_g1_i1.p1  ORF type:complete len:114 (+),score=22.44 TRINITY_DN10520_c0_g1_i1:3-344(+)
MMMNSVLLCRSKSVTSHFRQRSSTNHTQVRTLSTLKNSFTKTESVSDSAKTLSLLEMPMIQMNRYQGNDVFSEIPTVNRIDLERRNKKKKLAKKKHRKKKKGTDTSNINMRRY